MHSGEWRVGHAETGAYVLGEQFDRRSIANWIGLRQILHGFDQQALPIHIPRVRIALAAARYFWRHRNGKDFRHQ